jgi:hypothetical protein
MGIFRPGRHFEKNYRARIVFNELCEKESVISEDERGQQLRNLPAAIGLLGVSVLPYVACNQLPCIGLRPKWLLVRSSRWDLLEQALSQHC